MSITCRSCEEAITETVIDLGEQPLANSYLDPSEVGSERRFPLHARLCTSCGLVQVEDVVPAEVIFTDYAYFSSYADSWVAHAKQFADGVSDQLGLTSSDLVVELASNDGYLLQWFLARGLRVVGVEPAVNVANEARSRGIPTTVAFFTRNLARELVDREGPARLIVANNVLAHVPDLNDFVAGIALLLDREGVVSIEVPHLLELVEQTQFDTIYHEHYSYFSLRAVIEALQRHGLVVVDVIRLPTHGGSLRIFARHDGTPTEAVAKVLARESAAKLERPEGFAEFRARVESCREGLVEFLRGAQQQGRVVAAYGAAAKGNTLLNHAGVTAEQIAYVADRNPHKQGRLLPGSHVPIVAPERVVDDEPSYLLILPWNLREEIVEQMAQVPGWGGSFVTAVPNMRTFG